MLQTKMYKIKFPLNTGCICLPPPAVELEGSKDLPFFKYKAPEREWQIFEAPSLTTARDRHMHPGRFL